MRFATFLLGGICGAAAVIYFTGRNRSMLWSAMANNTGLGNMMNQSDGRNKQSGDDMNQSHNKSDSNKNQTAYGASFADAGSSRAQHTGSAGTHTTEDRATSSHERLASDGMEKVSAIVNEDPKLKSQVEEIMASSGKGKAEVRVQ